MKDIVRHAVYVVILINLFLLNLRFRELDGYAVSYDLSLKNISQYQYTIMTSFVHQCHWLGGHKSPTIGCDLCYNFVQSQKEQFEGVSKVDEIINENTGPKDMSKKLQRYFDENN